MISMKRASVILCLILAFGILTAGNATAGTKVPSLDKSKWTMYDIENGALTNNYGSTWNFESKGFVYDEPVWRGLWSNNDKEKNKIVIYRRDIRSPYSEYQYSVTFAGNDAFIASGSDEVSKNRILLGVRQK